MTRKRGRPARVEGQRADHALRIWLTPSERAALERMAIENHHASIAALVREAVNEFVADYGGRKIFSGAANSSPARILISHLHG